MKPLLALAAVLAALAAAAAGSASPAATVIGLDWGLDGSLIRPFDARTLEPVGAGRRLPVTYVQWSFSPDGRRLALVGERPNRGEALLVLDTATLRTLGSASLFGDLRLSSPRAVAWAAAGLLVVTSDLGRARVDLVDPDALTVRRVAGFEGEIVAGAPTDDGVVVLVAPAGRIGPVRLVSIGPGLAKRVVPLAIRGGTARPASGTPPETYVATMRQPALAVDPAGRRAVVVGYAEPIADVDLVRGSVRYHAVAVRTPAKAISGPTLVGSWLGSHTVGVTGMRYRGVDARGGMRADPFGLQLLDLRTWRLRVVDPDVAWLTATHPYLVALGVKRGLRWYGPTGRRIGSLFSRLEVTEVALAGDRALVRPAGDARAALVDLRTGRVLERRPPAAASLPLLLGARHGP
jgi:hypothetical protein